MPSMFSEIFPPAPTFTEADIPDQDGRVFVVTGGSAGVGLEVCRILFAKHGTVYMATRSESKMEAAIAAVAAEFPASRGSLHPLRLDLSDLAQVKRAAGDFLARESRLDVLVNNAAVMNTPPTAQSSDGHELQMGTNVLGPYLLTRLLEPLLLKTAAAAANSASGSSSPRVVFVSSQISMSVGTPKGGVNWDERADRPEVLPSAFTNYMQSKVGNVFMARDTAARLGSRGVTAVSLHPGIMKTELQRNSPAAMGWIMGMVFKPARYGAYTELFAALSPDVTPAHSGSFILPWGRFGTVPDHIEESMKPPADGGKSLLEKFIAYCERATTAFR